MSKDPVHCAIYTRKSSEEGLEQSFNSLEAQREACLAYIHSQKHEGWVDIKEKYDDGGFSGGNMERPALRRLLDDIRAGKVRIVVVYKVDRLTRSLPDFAKIIEVFDSQQVSFVSVTQQFNTTTSMGRLTLNVLLSFAQFERELTGERIRDKVAASKKKGMWMGGMVPHGYNCVNHRLVVDHAEAEIVREIFRQYLRLGSVGKLRDYLEQRQIHSKLRTSMKGRTSGGKIYSRGALYHLLGNRTYIGEIVHRGRSYPGQHEPIIERELWQQVEARLSANDRAQRTKGHPPSSSLLTGILRDTSGVRFTPTHAVKNGRRYRYYTSQAVIQHRGERPQVARYPARELETLVKTAVRRWLASLEHELSKEEVNPDSERAMQRAGRLASQWSEMEVSKQDEIVRVVVMTVTVGQRNIWIEVERAKLLNYLLGRSPTETPKADPIKLTVGFEPVRRGSGLQIHAQEDHLNEPVPIPSLVNAIARARRWYEELVSGEVNGVRQLAEKNNCTCAYVTRTLQLAVLGPEGAAAILSGRHPRHLTVGQLLQDLPPEWSRQRVLVS